MAKTNTKKTNTNKEVKETKKGLTEVAFILDMSGSMYGTEKDTVGGFNSFIEKQKKEDCDTLVTTVLFNNYYYVIHSRTNIQDIKELALDDYRPSGCTALLDAVGNTIMNIKNNQEHLKDSGIPEKTIIVITTDGLENASKEYTYDKVKRLISEMEEKYKWTFLFLADTIDAPAYGERIGIRADRIAKYKTSTDTRVMYDAVRVCCMLPDEGEKDFQTILNEQKKKKK